MGGSLDYVGHCPVFKADNRHTHS